MRKNSSATFASPHLAAARSLSKQKRRAVISALPSARKAGKPHQPRTETAAKAAALREPEVCACWQGGGFEQWPLRVTDLMNGLPPRCISPGRMTVCLATRPDGTNTHHLWLPMSGSEEPPHRLDLPFLCPATAGEDVATFAQHDYCPDCRAYIAARTFDVCPATPIRWTRCTKHTRHS
jgi:hypothetical protein